MRQVVQSARGGAVEVLEVPAPRIGPTEVLVRTVASVVSPGTERAVTALARSTLLAKARARPDLVRAVVERARADGIGSASRAVRAKLGGDVPLGYSAAGLAVEVGEAVAGIRPGHLVATGGAGHANHAETQAVPGLLCARVPDGVSAADAAFATVASIALHGFRLAEVGPGSKVLVVGLGLVGQLAARIAVASGCDVVGVDPAEFPRAAARRAGVLDLAEEDEATTARILAATRGRGADAVLVCAASRSSELMGRVPARARDRAPVVVVGDVGLELDRTPFYERELSVRFARSYGPGRYERSYEQWSVDYPPGQVRWSEGRNLEAVLDLLASGRLRVDDLVTHAFPVARAGDAYDLLASRREPYLAVRFDYPASEVDRPAPPVPTPRRARRPATGVGWVGAGAFSSAVLLPAFRAAGFERFVSVTSAGGLSARRFADRGGFERVAADPGAVADDPDVGVVVIATPHDTHAELVVRALAVGKHVWCEKPVALSAAELAAVEAAAADSAGSLFVGFNRRWSPAATVAAARLADRTEPLSLLYRVAAGPVPDGHWYADRRQGGRLLGEVCHFVDLCLYLNPSPVLSVDARGGGPREVALADDATVLLAHADGSLSVVVYSSARPRGVAKERLEALAGPTHLVIDDFRAVTSAGRPVWKGTQDKGHRAAVAAFRSHLRGDGPADDSWRRSSACTLAAAARLTGAS